MCDRDEWIILQSHYLVIHRPFRVNKNLQFWPRVRALCVNWSCIFRQNTNKRLFAEQLIKVINGSAKTRWFAACSRDIFCLSIFAKLWRGRGELQGQQTAQCVQHCQVPQWRMHHGVRDIRGVLHRLGVRHARSGTNNKVGNFQKYLSSKGAQGRAPAPAGLECAACSVELVDRQLQ